MTNIRAMLRGMSRDEKYAEYKRYWESMGYFNLDIDRIKADQAILGAPDSALDMALIKIAYLAGATLGREPLTAKELKDALMGADPGINQILRRRSPLGAARSGEVPERSLRKSAVSNLHRAARSAK